MKDFEYSVMQTHNHLYFFGEYVPKTKDIQSYGYYKAVMYDGNSFNLNMGVGESNMYDFKKIFQDIEIANFLEMPSLDFQLQGKTIKNWYGDIIANSKQAITTDCEFLCKSGSDSPFIIPTGTKIDLTLNSFTYKGERRDWRGVIGLPSLPQSVLVRNENEWVNIKQVLTVLEHDYVEIDLFPKSIAIDENSKTITINEPNAIDINGKEFYNDMFFKIWR